MPHTRNLDLLRPRSSDRFVTPTFFPNVGSLDVGPKVRAHWKPQGEASTVLVQKRVLFLCYRGLYFWVLILLNSANAKTVSAGTRNK